MSQPMDDVSQPICVLGMHRSGTSLIAGALHHMGVNLGPPQRLLSAGESNERGHWEHRKLVKVNDKLLRALGGKWHRPPYLDPGWERAAAIPELEETARSYIERDLAHAPVWAWKDPRTCLTLPFWRRIVSEPRYVVCLRNPAEVSASLAKRDGLFPSRAVYLWLRYTAEALRQTNGQPREFFVYEDFLARWREEIERLASIAGVEGSVDLGNFVDPSLRHHSASQVDLRANGAGDGTIAALAEARELYASVRDGRPPDSDETSRLLTDALELLLPELAAVQVEELDRRVGAERLAREIVERIPAQEAAVVIDDGAVLRGLEPDGRIAFAMDQPADDAAAVDQLDRVRAGGVRFLVLAWPARWWLDRYSAFRARLQRDWRVLKDTDPATFYEALEGDVSCAGLGHAASTVSRSARSDEEGRMGVTLGRSDVSAEELGIGLDPGTEHYRAYVGPPEDYDLIAAMSFSLLAALGLRQHHTLLDIGCGSLRIGRLLIPYLNRGNYIGIEPSERLVANGLDRELGHDIVAVKEPLFVYADSAEGLIGRRQVDFALAQSIFSHCGPDLLDRWMGEAAAMLTPTGALVATFVEGKRDTEQEGWIYPDAVRYTENTIRQVASRHDLVFQRLDWRHPRQTWVLAAKRGFDSSWLDGRPLAWNTWLDYGPKRSPK